MHETIFSRNESYSDSAVFSYVCDLPLPYSFANGAAFVILFLVRDPQAFGRGKENGDFSPVDVSDSTSCQDLDLEVFVLRIFEIFAHFLDIRSSSVRGFIDIA